MTQEQKAIVHTIANGQKVNKKNVSLNSLARPGGTLSPEEASKEIKSLHKISFKESSPVYFFVNEDNLVIFNKDKVKEFKVKEEYRSDYIYKFKKTQVVCQSKKHLITHFQKSCDIDSEFKAFTYGMFNRLINK